MLAMIHAQLGEKNDALRAAARAREVFPISSDSFDGPILATTLAALGCDSGQGFYFSKPLEADAALEFWKSRKRV